MTIAVLISGRGSNLRAIVESGLPVSLVISNRAEAQGLPYAASHGIRTAIAEDDKTLHRILTRASPHIIALAGYMRILSPDIVRTFGARTTNIHPSLLPKYRGLHTHRRALSAGEREHGCTVHWITEAIDEGEIIAQSKVQIHPNDTEQTLAARVLKAEHKLYPKTLHNLLTHPTKAKAA